jgi:serine/threonine-protein kinase
LARIGCGGMGEIYLAVLRRDGAFEKRLAIKRILPVLSRDPSFVSLFSREARLAALLNHQNIVQVYDYGREGDDTSSPECVEGSDLRT